MCFCARKPTRSVWHREKSGAIGVKRLDTRYFRLFGMDSYQATLEVTCSMKTMCLVRSMTFQPPPGFQNAVSFESKSLLKSEKEEVKEDVGQR